MSISFGNVPLPAHERRIISNPDGSDPQASPRSIVGTCVHRMDGTLTGTDSFFRQPGTEALTDYGIGGALDDPSLDGVIYMWNDPTGSIVPYANGPADGLEGDGPAFVNAYPASSAVPDPVNSILASIELSGCSGRPDAAPFCQGRPETPVTAAQFESLCQLIAYWHDQAQVPWDQFPVNPASGVVTQMQHYEFSAKECPFPIVRGMTTSYQDRVREIMRSSQESGTPPPSGDYSKADIVKTTAAMNLRVGPGTGSTVIGSLPVNAILVLEGPSEYRDGAWWFQHRSHWGYGWSTDRFTEYAGAQNFSRNPGGGVGPLTGIRAIGGATISNTPSGQVRVDCPAGSANAGVQYSSYPNLNIGDGRSVIALWDLLGLYGNNYDFMARYSDGTTQQVGGPYAGSEPNGAVWARNYSTVLTLNGSKVCNELLFRMRNQGTAARVFHIDNVDFISL